MKTFLCLLLFISQTAFSASIVERRIWVETAIDDIKEDQCQDTMKNWRCLFPDRKECIKAMKEVYVPCAPRVLPDMPEYIDGPETKAQATKVVVDCMTTELTKKYILGMLKERLDEYNVCTGAVARSKPLSANLQKALEFSKTQTAHSCAAGGFLRKCYQLGEAECKDRIDKYQQDCTMKMEADGVSVKKEDAAIQEAGRRITDCALRDNRKSLDSTRKRIKDKECD